MNTPYTNGRWYVYTNNSIMHKKGTALAKILDPKRDEVHWVFSTAEEGGDKLMDARVMSKAKDAVEVISEAEEVFHGFTVQDLSPEAYKAIARLQDKMTRILQDLKS